MEMSMKIDVTLTWVTDDGKINTNGATICPDDPEWDDAWDAYSMARSKNARVYQERMKERADADKKWEDDVKLAIRLYRCPSTSKFVDLSGMDQ